MPGTGAQSSESEEQQHCVEGEQVGAMPGTRRLVQEMMSTQTLKDQESRIVVHTCNLKAQAAEAGGS